MFYCFRYCAALLYDAFILLAIYFGITFFCVGVKGGAIAPDTPWYQLMLLSVTIAYYVISYRFGAQTIGQKAWRLRLESASSGKIDTVTIMLRLILWMPSVMIGIIMLKKPFYFLNKRTKTQLYRCDS